MTSDGHLTQFGTKISLPADDLLCPVIYFSRDRRYWDTQRSDFSLLEFSQNTWALPESSLCPLRPVLWVLRVQSRQRPVLGSWHECMCVCLCLCVELVCL